MTNLVTVTVTGQKRKIYCIISSVDFCQKAKNQNSNFSFV